MYKLSRYIEHVDFFDQIDSMNKVIIYSSRSSRCLNIDFTTWEKLQAGLFNEVNEKIISQLYQANVIVDTDEDELKTILNENKDSLANTNVLYFSVQPSANCSLGCDYCGQDHENGLLSEEHQLKFLEHVERKLSPQHTVLAICWFGAEPLNGIKVIRSLSPRLQQLASDKGLSYTATVVTNALSLTEEISHELVCDFAVHKIEITIDGTKEYHDQRRHTKLGKGTFDKIYSNMLFLADHYGDQIEVSLRCNVDDRNKENMPEFIKMLSHDKIFEKCQFYFAPIHSWGNDAHTLVNDKKQWSREQIEWFIHVKESGGPVTLLPKRVKNLCMAVSKDAQLIDPHGSVFKCSEVSLVPFYMKEGKNVHLMGHLSDEKSMEPPEKNQFGQFYDENVIKDYPCSSCSLFPVCGGMCPKEWMEGRNACPPMKFNIKERLMLKYLWSKEPQKQQTELQYE